MIFWTRSRYFNKRFQNSLTMSLFLLSTILILFIQSNHASTDADLVWSIQEDLKVLNVSCPDGTCTERRTGDFLEDYSCQCGAICAQYGTCCIDSPFRTRPPPSFRPNCRSLYGGGSYYMVDRCPQDSPFKNLCEEEWNGDDYIMKFVPVTSLFTLITYKNYFCFRCHEAIDDFRYWNVKLENYNLLNLSISENKPISLTYDLKYQTWVSPVGDNGSLVPVALNIKAPLKIYSPPVSCDTKLISNCSDAWSDEDVRKKCEAYMGIILILNYNSYYTSKYKNVHCALCNFEDVEKIYCDSPFVFLVRPHDKQPFSFTYLIDINRSDGDLVGKKPRCKSTHVWDPYAKICRELMCALPGYVIRNGKCEAP